VCYVNVNWLWHNCVNAVHIVQTFAYVCYLLSEFSGQCEDTSLDEIQFFSDLTVFLLHNFL